MKKKQKDTHSLEKLLIKQLKKIHLLHELSFYGKISIVKISEAFKRCARSYKTKIIDSIDPLDPFRY